MMEEREKQDWRMAKRHYIPAVTGQKDEMWKKIRDGKMQKWTSKNTKDVQRER